jgi:hypothetical protein
MHITGKQWNEFNMNLTESEWFEEYLIFINGNRYCNDDGHVLPTYIHETDQLYINTLYIMNDKGVIKSIEDCFTNTVDTVKYIITIDKKHEEKLKIIMNSIKYIVSFIKE